MLAKSRFVDWKWVAAFAAAGALAAGAVSYFAPSRYASTAVLRLRDSNGNDNRRAGRLVDLKAEVLDRASLAAIIQKRSLDLYREERIQLPLEDVILLMKDRDTHIDPIAARTDANSTAFEVAFDYPDPRKAQAAARELTARFLEADTSQQRERASQWQADWGQPAPAEESLAVLEPASLPEQAISSDRGLFVLLGLGGGSLLGIQVLQMWRQTWRTVTVMAGAAAGFALAGGLAFLIPDRWVSSAVVRLKEPVAPSVVLAQAALPPTDQLWKKLREEVLSRQSLIPLVLKPSLNLFVAERSRKPLEEVVDRMRARNIAIVPLGKGYGLTFRISFEYGDQYKAQAVVRELITRFTEYRINHLRELAQKAGGDFQKMANPRRGPNFEVMEPASLPEDPVSPNRLAIAFGGLPVGALGGVWLGRRRRLQATLPLGAPVPAGL